MKFLAFILSLLLAVLTVAFIGGLWSIVLWLAFNYWLEALIVIATMGLTIAFYGDMTRLLDRRIRK